MTPVKNPEPESLLNPDKLKRFLPMIENMKNHEKDSMKSDIIKRDFYMLFFPIL